MRMFLIAMCDIFLILYLTAFTSTAPKSFLTMDDFNELKNKYEVLQSDTQKSEVALANQLDKIRQEKEKLAEEKKDIEVKLTEKEKIEEEERKRIQQLQESLVKDRAEKDEIAKNLREAERMLKLREQTMSKLSYNTLMQEEERRKIESSFQEELEKQKEAVVKNQEMLAEMQKKTTLAVIAAEEAKTVQKMAVQLKDQALKAKEDAEQKAVEALATSYRAEVEKKKALAELKEAKINREKAEENADRLETAIKDIKQDGDSAYKKNVRPHLQKLKATYTKKVNNDDLKYERELMLLPIKIDNVVYVIFPSSQVGFRQRSDRAPNDLIMVYNGKPVTKVKLNKEDDLIAVEVPNYSGIVHTPYPKNVDVKELMPTLLSLRNNGNRSLLDSIRGVSDDYYIVKRDYLQTDEQKNLEYNVSGFRGTGAHGERIVQGDQLVDLTGRLIGIAADADKIIRINTLKAWEDVAL